MAKVAINYFALQEKDLQLRKLVATLKALRKCEVCICQIVSSTLLLWCGLTRDHSCGSAFFLFVFFKCVLSESPSPQAFAAFVLLDDLAQYH